MFSAGGAADCEVLSVSTKNVTCAVPFLEFTFNTRRARKMRVEMLPRVFLNLHTVHVFVGVLQCFLTLATAPKTEGQSSRCFGVRSGGKCLRVFILLSTVSVFWESWRVAWFAVEGVNGSKSWPVFGFWFE